MDNQLYIRHASLYTPNLHIDDASILIRGQHIEGIGREEEIDSPYGAFSIDARGLTVAPGLIDLQLNGAFGDDFAAHPETIWRVATQLPRYGITSFLPTIVTSPLTRVDAARAVLLHERPPSFCGAEPLGLHLEGPFLNPLKKGAHNPNYMLAPDTELVADWSPATAVRLVTLAPELPNALELVRMLTAQGVIVSAGHSMATAEQANTGFAAGIRYATHLFNAMPPLDHYAPGLPGSVLANPGWTTGLIADGIHVHPTLVRAVWLTKGSRKLNLVSDAMGALGMPPGRYRLNDFDVFVSDRDARLQSGTLAGSILPLDEAVRNLVTFSGCSLPDAIATVTSTPARVLKLESERGHIAPGQIADLVLLDAECKIVMTIAAGNIMYQRDR